MASKLIKLRYRNIPQYLHAGQFYRCLSSDDPDGIIEVPSDCFMKTSRQTCDFELVFQVMSVAQFWMLDELPRSLVNCSEDEVIFLRRALRKEHLWDILRDVFPFKRLIKVDGTRAAVWASEAGHLRALKYIHSLGFTVSREANAPACSGGHLECVQFLDEVGAVCDFRDLYEAAEHGHTHIVQYAYEKIGVLRNSEHTRRAALNGHLACLVYAHSNGCPCNWETVEAAVRNNHVECLRYLLLNGCHPRSDACCMAASLGHVECLKLIWESEVTRNPEVILIAASRPDIACLQYLHENGCPWKKEVLRRASKGGGADCLKYALENGCPFDEDYTLKWAVRNSSWQSIKYLVEEKGLSVAHQDLFIEALFAADLPSLQYLLANGCPCATARFRFNSEELDLLRRHVYIWVKRGEFIRCVSYAMEQGWKMDATFLVFIQYIDGVITRREDTVLATERTISAYIRVQRWLLPKRSRLMTQISALGAEDDRYLYRFLPCTIFSTLTFSDPYYVAAIFTMHT